MSLVTYGLGQSGGAGTPSYLMRGVRTSDNTIITWMAIGAPDTAGALAPFPVNLPSIVVAHTFPNGA